MLAFHVPLKLRAPNIASGNCEVGILPSTSEAKIPEREFDIALESVANLTHITTPVELSRIKNVSSLDTLIVVISEDSVNLFSSVISKIAILYLRLKCREL